MQDDRFWLLVSLKLSGEATQEDLAALEAHLQAHPELGLRLETLYNLWQGPAPASSSRRSGALSRHLQRLSNHLSEPALVTAPLWGLKSFILGLTTTWMILLAAGSAVAEGCSTTMLTF